MRNAAVECAIQLAGATLGVIAAPMFASPSGACSCRPQDSGVVSRLSGKRSKSSARQPHFSFTCPEEVAVKKSLAVLAISAASLTAMPAAASAKTLRLFSKPIPQVGGPFDANGNPLTGAPAPGDYFVGGDRLYKGAARHHARGVFGYDHIVCTILD